MNEGLKQDTDKWNKKGVPDIQSQLQNQDQREDQA